jgi:hypothetical protein
VKIEASLWEPNPNDSGRETIQQRHKQHGGNSKELSTRHATLANQKKKAQHHRYHTRELNNLPIKQYQTVYLSAKKEHFSYSLHT